jgi:hypothetical protein
MKKRTYSVAIFVVVIALVLSACGPSTTPSPTPTPVDVGAVATSAIQTFVAQLTQDAPTVTPTPIATATPITTATSTQPRVTLAPPTAASCNGATYVADKTIPDGTQMAFNQTFTKTWTVKNSGTCNWTTSFKLAFSYGESMGGAPVAFTTTVTPGQTVDISVKLTAPNKTGKLTGVWTLLDDKSQPFGQLLTVVINVGPASTTPTATGGATSTKTPVPTETPTITVTPNPT